MASSSSLSSVVSNLVRASMGTSVSSTVTDEDLDRHVAELLIKDAKKRAERYGQQGIRAYLSSQLSDSNAPKTNKRFLSSIIRSTDEHNKTILKAQALSAQEIQREKEELQRKQRRARAEEAVAARRTKLDSRKSADKESWDSIVADGTVRPVGTSRDVRRGVVAVEAPAIRTSLDSKHTTRSHRSRHSTRHTSRRSRSRHHHSKSRRRRGSHSRTRSPSQKPSRSSSRSERARDQSPSDARNLSDSRNLSKEAELRQKLRASKDKPPSILAKLQESESRRRSLTPPSKRRKTRSPSVESTLSSPMSISPSASPGPEPSVQLPSKMDKYFEESYDPRLDVAPLSVPKFEGWDAMLELIRVRREDKDEKKRLERMGLSKEQIKKEISSSKAVGDRWNSGGATAMDIEYKKRGTVREWDLGKDTV
ncbi:hypothetical protein IW261DRAFT_1550588 [Armillaria novae-zelandiae]|uniref:Uncharacterized protein n=1 Tax=Armillaria novae-zelandiae TaxID=153914 RepID=A0AA39PC41_9AGAR|nr:hypothetical protein IW261DRAFT_1550588 [Armillaria novae-zelandiae]